MILLVIGLVAVIVVVLIAVFLSFRLGRGDEDDEPDVRSGGRDRRRNQDERWRERDTRRVPSSARTSGRDGPTQGPGGYDGDGSRGPAGDRDSRGRDHVGASRRPARPGTPGSRQSAAARPAAVASAPARGSSDIGPSRRLADGYPAGDHPSGEYPAADYGAVDDPRDRPAARHKASAAPAAGKSRSRQRGKRGDDDDWPSTEWDKLSDEQYWAELSADKPLASMARPSKPAKEPAATAPANGKAKARPAARDARPARPPGRDLPGHKEHAGQRGPATERLPVRSDARRAPAAASPPRRPDAAGRSYPGPRTVHDTGPRPLRDTGPQPTRDTGPQPRGDQRRRDTRDRDLAVLNGLASSPPPIPGALEDDPLTSPSFSLRAGPASDSRSYGNARKHARGTGQPATNAANGNGNGNGHGGYPAAGYASAGYAYQAAPVPPAPQPAPGAEWYSARPAPATPPDGARAPGYGDPYRYTGGGSGGPGPGFGGNPATAGYPSYLADPLHVSAPPGYQEPAPYPEPAPPAYPPTAAGAVPDANGYPGHPYSDRSGYPGGYTANGPAPGYQDGYQAEPYAGGGHGTYPPQG